MSQRFRSIEGSQSIRPHAVAEPFGAAETVEQSPKGTGLGEKPRSTESSTRPRMYYGWFIFPMALLTVVASFPGQTFGISVFNEPMRLALHLSHSQLAGAYSLGTILGALPIMLIGWMMDRFRLRRSLLVVITMFAATCFFTAYVSNWFMLVAAFTMLRMLGPGALSFLGGNILPFWFERRLGTVEGLRQLGMAVAMMVVPIVNLALVQTSGWRGAYVIFGASIWLVLFPYVYFFFRNRPADVGQHLDGLLGDGERHGTVEAEPDWGLTVGQAMRTCVFWVVSLSSVTFGLIHTAIFFCLVPILLERGLSEEVAATTLFTFAACLAPMQLIGGILADYFRPKFLVAVSLLGLAGSMVLFKTGTAPSHAWLAGGLLGLSQGLYFGVTSPLWPRFFGRRHIGTIRGLLMTMMVALSSLGPLMAGMARDHWSSFEPAIVAFAILPLPFVILAILIEPPKSPIPTTPADHLANE